MPPAAPASTSNKTVMIVLAVVVLLAVVGGAVLLSGGDDDESGGGEASSESEGPLSGGGDGSGEAPAESGGGGSSSGEGGGSVSSDTDAVEEVVRDYTSAAGDALCLEMVELVSENMLGGSTEDGAVNECRSQAAENPEAMDLLSSVIVVDTQVDGDVATVEGHATAAGGSEPTVVTFTLVREGGTWLIDDISTS